MKIVTKEDLANHRKATIQGLKEGFVAGSAASSVGFLMLHRLSPYYRSLPIPIKALGFALVIAPCVEIQAERRGLRYDKEHNWDSAGKREMDREEQVALQRWNALSTKGKMGDWALRHRWHLFLAAWAATLAGSWMVLRRHKTQSFAQKIVQARVYAQGVSVAGLLGGTALSHKQLEEAKKEQWSDHSWARLLEYAQEAKKTEGTRVAHAARA